MNAFWCCALGLHRTYHVCQVLGYCLDAACLPNDQFFHYRSKDKSLFTALPSVTVRNDSCLSFIHGAQPTETKWGGFRFWYRSTTKELRASLANQAFICCMGPFGWAPQTGPYNSIKDPLECAKVHNYHRLF